MACSDKPRFTLWMSKANADIIAAYTPFSAEWMEALHEHPPFGISAITGQGFEAYNPLAIDLHEDMVPNGEVLHDTTKDNIEYICCQRGGLLPGGLEGGRHQVHFCLVNPDTYEIADYQYPAEFSSSDLLHPYDIPKWKSAEIHLNVKYCREMGLTPVVHPGYSGTFAPKMTVPVEAIVSVIDRKTRRVIWSPPVPPCASYG